MKWDELNRAFVSNSQTDQGDTGNMPAVIATGPTKYFAQVGIGEQSQSSSTPGGFKAILDQHAHESAAPIANLERFNQMLDDIRHQFNDPGAGEETPPGFLLRANVKSGERNLEIEELRGKLKNLIDKQPTN